MNWERSIVILGALGLSWVVPGCSGSLSIGEADDDAADDDVSDDDAGDDDTGDDDVGDDDAADDDTGDDDTMPAHPGIEFSVPSGQLAGDYAFHVDAWCGPDDGWEAEAAGNGMWDEFLILYLNHTPQAGAHYEQPFWVGGMLGDTWMEVDHGGADCYIDIVGDAPIWGTFTCAGLEGWGHPTSITADLEDGVFRCP